MTGPEPTVVIQKGETTPVLLEILGARLGNLPSGHSKDVKRFKQDLDAALLGLRRLSEELKANFNVCPHICERLLSPERTAEYFSLLGGDELQRLKVKTKLEALGSCLQEAEQVLRSLPAIVEKAPSADRVSDAEMRRSVKIILGHYKDLHDELLEWKKTAHRSLEKIRDSGLFERFDIDVSLPVEQGRGDERKGTAATGDKRSPSTRTGQADQPDPAAQPEAERADRSVQPQRDAATKRPEKGRRKNKEAGGTSEAKRSLPADLAEPFRAGRTGDRKRELEDVQARLLRWARWRPMAPSRVARDARLSESRRVKVKMVTVRALWGERRATEITRPYEAKEVGPPAHRSLWDLHATPPQGFSEGGESTVRVPGGDSVVECRACSGGGVACRKCDGTGKLLCFRVCDTRYFTQSLSERIAPEDLPARLAALEEGKKVFQDYVFYPPSKNDSLRSHHRKCLEAISEQAGSDVRKMIVRRLLPEARRGQRGAERQLIRVSLEITTVPVREYSCESPYARRSGRRFRAWLYGRRQKRLYVEGYPREFTLKAVALLLAIGLAGVPLGFALMRWITAL